MHNRDISIDANAVDGTAAPTSLVEVLCARSAAQRDETAFIFLHDGEAEAARITYGELDRRARVIAAYLQQIDQAGERVLILCPPGVDYVAAFFGCLYAAAIAVPSYPPRVQRLREQVQPIVANCQANVVLTTSSVLETISRRLPQESELAALRWVAVDDLMAGPVTERSPTPIIAESVAFLQYTSGSTGHPKGVMVTHRNLIHCEEMIHQGFQTTKRTVGVSWLPLYHDMGLIGNVLLAIYIGRPCILMSPAAFIQKPIRWLQAISRYKATMSGGPDFAYRLCVRKTTPEQRQSLDLRTWELALSGAEMVRPDTIESFSKTFAPCGFRPEAFYPSYGMAEATLIISGGQKFAKPVIRSFRGADLSQRRAIPVETSDPDAHRLVGCGRILGDQRLMIVDPTTRHECREHEIGEIWLAGSNVAQGYWNRPEETAKNFGAQLADGDEGPFLRTGDLGFICQGELFLAGRLKNLIIIRGRNHYPHDIEQSVQRSHPALREALGAAFAVEIDSEERLVVVQEVEREHLRNLNIDEVLGAIRQAIAEEHELSPIAIVLLKPGGIPKTSSGKIRHSACREGFIQESLDVVGIWRECVSDIGFDVPPESIVKSENLPQSTMESVSARSIRDWLVASIAERLQLPPEQVDVREPMTRYGLDSVSAVNLAESLERLLGRKLSPTIAFDYPSIEALSQHLGQELESPSVESGLKPPAEAGSEEIAIIGLGCRFPGADSPAEFWRLLIDGVDAVTEVPHDRWDIDRYFDPTPAVSGRMNTRWGGFLHGIDLFDPEFFGIAPREAQMMDPQHRLLLEVSWRALENAGLPPHDLAGSRTGVFVGIGRGDYSNLLLQSSIAAQEYIVTGNSSSVAANRISYLLDLRGPSLAIDCACSSSLVAVHQAVQSLRRGECDLAVAGGVNVILSPELTIAFSQARMMASDGRCKSFDAAADGYVRSEGCGMVVLKRLSEAQRDGDNVLAVIVGSAINQDGRSQGLTAPNGPSQQALIREALQDARVKPAEIGYVEAHGSGTSLGDPIEVNSLRAVILDEREAGDPCWIGSVKTNIGHLEAAAGIAGLIKTVLSLQHGEIPENIHFKELNSHIAISGTALAVANRRQPWTRNGRKRLAGVSAFGFGGTNAHVVLSEPPPPRANTAQPDRPCQILAISGKDREAISQLAKEFHALLSIAEPSQFADICHAANAGRCHFAERLAVVSRSSSEAVWQLSQFTDQPVTQLVTGVYSGRARPNGCRVAFVFGHEECRGWNFGRELYETQTVFREEILRCEALTRDFLDRPIREIAISDSGGDLVRCAPALFALQYSLAQLWLSWGVRPVMTIGAGMGEFAAACVAGMFSVEHALILADAHFRLTCRSAGDDEFREVCRQVTFHEPRLPVISGFDGQRLTSQIATPEYWRRSVREPMQFAAAMSQSDVHGCNAFLEIGSNLSLLERETNSPVQDGGSGENRPAFGCEWDRLLSNLARLYVRGMPVDWLAFDRPFQRRKVSVPGYPFRRRRLWFSSNADPTDDPLPSHPNEPFSERVWRVQPRNTGLSTGSQLGTPTEINQQLAPLVAKLIHPTKSVHYVKFLQSLEELSAAYVVKAMLAIGWNFHLHERFTTPVAAARLSVPEGHQRFLQRLLEILAEEGFVQKCSTEWEVLRPLEYHDPGRYAEALESQFIEGDAELEVLTYCGSHLAEVLQGRRDLGDVASPGCDTTLAARMYHDTQQARILNSLVAEAVRAAIEHWPRRRTIRILEVGAGTGEITSSILRRLPTERIEYTFSDVSSLFITKAKQRFREYPFVVCRTLDIEQPPENQGFRPHEYQIIVAGNALCATRDLNDALSQIDCLLAPGGMLVLLEGTRPQRWVDLFLGTNGWWGKFTDAKWRPSHPYLGGEDWLRLLQDRQLIHVTAITSTDNGVEVPFQQSVIMARSRAFETPRRSADRTVWIILSERQGIAGRLADALRRAGDVCLLGLAEATSGMSQRDGFTFDPAGDAPITIPVEKVLCDDKPPRCSIVYLCDSVESTTQAGDADASGVLHKNAEIIIAKLIGGLPVFESYALSLVTCGVPCVEVGGRLCPTVESSLWDLSRKLVPQVTDVKCARIDLDPTSSEDHRLAALLDELCLPEEIDCVAFRDGQRYVLQVLACEPSLSRDRDSSEQISILQRLKSASPGQRRGLLVEYLRREIAHVMEIDDFRPEEDQPLIELGLDSLMAFDLRTQVKTDLNLDLSLMKLIDDTSIGSLAETLDGQLDFSNTVPPDDSGTDAPPDPSAVGAVEGFV